MSATRNKMANGVIDLDKARQVKLDVADDVAELEKKRFGWDGAHALPVRQDVITEIKFRLLSTYGMDFRCLPRPDILAGTDGTVALVFRVGNRKLQVHIKCIGIAHCFAENGNPGSDGGVYCLDKIVRMAQGAPATGYAAEIDEWADWLLGLEQIG